MSAHNELVELLRDLRPKFGAVGSRDVDVRAQQQQIDAAIAAIEALAAPVPQQAAGDASHMDVPTVWAAFRTWAGQNLGRAYSLEHREGVYTDKVTRWCFNGFKAGLAVRIASPSSEGEPQ